MSDSAAESKAVATPALKLIVTYCEHCRFGPRFTALKAALLGLYPNELEVVGDNTGAQGSFDVKIEHGAVLHAKLAQSEGLVDTKAKLQKIRDGIDKELAKRKTVPVPEDVKT